MRIKHITLLILFSIGIKIAYLIFSIGMNGSNDSISNEYIGCVKKNDSYWYQRIATNGYPKINNKRDLGYSNGPDFKQSEWAFFPLYPGMNAITSNIFNISFDTSAFIWSILFSLLSVLGIYWFGLIFFKDQLLALFCTLIIFCFPFSFYYSMFYTEAVFMTFTIFSFICIHYKRYLFLSLLLIPLTLIRPNGIIILIPLYLYFLEQKKIIQHINIDWKRLLDKKNILQSLFFISAPVTFFAYAFYQYEMTGYPFAFSIAQAGWYKELTFPLFSFFRRGDVATQFNSVFAIIVILYFISVWKKLPLSLSILVLLSLLTPLCAGSVTSMTRYVSVLFPLFMILSSTIYQLKSKYLILLLILALHFLSYYGWITNHSISF